jgi:large subunit ribosomal protein L4
METKIYNQKGKEAGSIKLPETVFGLTWNADLMHQVVVSSQSNKRAGTANARTRGEVSGGGKKPWKQKGTGRARHGSIRSPLWKGGGVTHGPLAEKNYSKKINKKMKRKALMVALSRKVKDGQVLFVDALSLSEPKTKEASIITSSLSKVGGFEKLAGKRKNTALLLLPEKNAPVLRAFRNLPAVTISELQKLNALDALSYRYLIMVNPEESVKLLNK